MRSGLAPARTCPKTNPKLAAPIRSFAMCRLLSDCSATSAHCILCRAAAWKETYRGTNHKTLQPPSGTGALPVVSQSVAAERHSVALPWHTEVLLHAVGVEKAALVLDFARRQLT